MKLSTKTILILSEMLDKMDIKNEIKNIDAKSNEEVGKELLILITTKIYKVQDLIYKLIIDYKNIKVEPKFIDSDEETKNKNLIEQAEKIDFIEIIKELINIEGLKDFLSLKQE